MKLSLTIFGLIFFSVATVKSHDDKQAGDHRDVYVTEVNGNFLSTTDENLRIFSKLNGESNLLTAKHDELINAILLIPKKWGDRKIVDFQIYTTENGKRTLLGGFPLFNFGKTVEVIPECNSYVFVIRKEYFDSSMIVFSSDTEEIYLHLQPNPDNKANKMLR